MAYAWAIVSLLGLVIVIALVLGQRRRIREMRALRSVMRQVIDSNPDSSQGKAN